MSGNIFVTVNVQVGHKNLNIKMERGTTFEYMGCIFNAEKDGQTVKLHNYQMEVFRAVANNFKETAGNDIVLSKKDIDIAIQKYSKGGLGKDLGEFLGGNYRVQNPKAFKDENKISAYITNGKPSASAVLSFKYDSNTQSVEKEERKDTIKINQSDADYKVFKNSNIIEKPAFKYTLKKHDTLVSIAKEFELDTYQIVAANPQLKQGVDYKVNYRKNNIATIDTYIKEGATITIPARYSVKAGSVRNLNDLCKITGLSEGYIKDLLTVIEVKPTHPGKPDLTTYNDGYGTPTIGYGHTGRFNGKDLSLKKKVTITEAQALELLAEDLIKHEAMVIAYLGKENYEKAPASVRSAIVDIAYNKGIWDGFKNPYHNSATSKIKSDLESRNYASTLCDTRRMNTPNRGLKRRNLYRFISGLTDLSPAKREAAMKEMNGYYRSVLNTLKGAEYTYLKNAWENAKAGKTTGYRIQLAQKDRG